MSRPPLVFAVLGSAALHVAVAVVAWTLRPAPPPAASGPPSPSVPVLWLEAREPGADSTPEPASRPPARAQPAPRPARRERKGPVAPNPPAVPSTGEAVGTTLPPCGSPDRPCGPETSAGGGSGAQEGGEPAAPGGGGEREGSGQAQGEVADLRPLHRKLEESARRCYPAAARRYRLEGSVGLSFCLDGAGAASSFALEGSTGSPILDRAARECVLAGAQPLPAPAGCYRVPVRFGGG